MTEPYYSDDAVTLFLGDCREVTEWLAADVLVTDPPYGVAWTRRLGGTNGDTKRKSIAHEANVVIGDDSTVARDEALALWGGRPAMVFGSWKAPRPPETRALLIWHKEGAYSGPLNAPFFTNHEDVYVMGEGWRSSSPPLRSVITTSEHRSVAAKQSGHPTPKPVELMERLVDRCPPGVIADPFAGSGSTLVAARNLGRKAIGVELEERYCEVIAKRLAQDCLPLFEVAE